ncbi:MAG TPA: hypothetical protein VIL47_03510 [Candidatus Bipolaricaulota bacterium]
MNTVPNEKRDCPYVGPWAISREIWIGQFCWHPDNLDAKGRPHLQSHSCTEWPQCPLLKDQLQKALH